jgi:glycogen(starch) synthase
MRVLVVSNLFPPVQFGGYELLAHRVTEGFRAKGHDVDVLTSDCLADTVEEDPAHIKRVLKLTTNFPRQGEEVGFVDFRRSSINRVAKKNFELTRQQLASQPYDAVFCWCMNRMSLGAVFAAQAAGVPVCYTVNDEHPKQFAETPWQMRPDRMARRVAEETIWPMATFGHATPFPITTISRFLQDVLVEHGCPLEEAEVIYQGADIEKFPYQPSLRGDATPIKLLFAGQICENKGVHTILRAVGELRRRGIDAQLDIVGHGVPDYRKKLDDIVEEQSIGAFVNFRGFVPHSEIPSVFHDHHVLIFATEITEGFGLSHVEAMACGCAVVSTTVGGCAELIRHGENSLAFGIADPVDLANQIESLYSDEALRSGLLERARNHVEQHHTLEGYIDQLEDFVIRTAGLSNKTCPPQGCCGQTQTANDCTEKDWASPAQPPPYGSLCRSAPRCRSYLEQPSTRH